MSVILETKQLCKFYGAGENQVKAVNQVDIQIEQGEFVALVCFLLNDLCKVVYP